MTVVRDIITLMHGIEKEADFCEDQGIDLILSRLFDEVDGSVTAAHAAVDSYAARRQQAKAQPSAIGDVIISADYIAKQYNIGGRHINALRDISLTIREGEFVAITGPSGSGKSTLLHIIGCLDKPTTGTLRVAGQDTARLNDKDLSILRQNTIGFIFQSFYLQPFLRLRDNLAVPAMFTRASKRSINDRVALLLKHVGLTDRAQHFPRELSGGQIQRAAIARSLMNSPRIILADEPTGNLDSSNSAAIIKLFNTIRKTLGTTVVIVTHDQSIAQQADRVIGLRDGVVV